MGHGLRRSETRNEDLNALWSRGIIPQGIGVLRRQATAFLVLACVLFLGGCPEDAPAGQSRSANRRAPTPLLPAEEAWLVMLPAPPSAAGVMDERRVFVPLQTTTEEGSPPGLVALNRESGAIEWTSSAQSQWPPVLGPELLFLSAENEVQALDPSTGKLKWRAQLPGNPIGPVAFGGTSLLVATEPADLTALRSSTGEIVWTKSLGAAPRAAAVLEGEETAFLPLSDGRVVALSVGTGLITWERKLSGDLTPLSVARERVMVGSTDNVFYALDSDDGDIAWKWRTGGDVIGSVADDNGVYFVALDNIVRGVNRGNGNQRWKEAISTRPAFAPILLEGTVAVGGVDPALSTFNAKTGTTLGTYKAPSELRGPVLVDSVPRPFRVAMVVLLRDGHITGLRPVEMMFREAASQVPAILPGRPLARERLP